MKKLFFIAVMASVAFASCTKNEPAPTVKENQAITFAAPVVSNLTKASVYYSETLFPTTQSFDVFAYYHEGDFAGTGVSYMDDVTVSYDNTLGTDGDAGTGAWSAEGYYWPKNGKLTFDAYAPSSITMTSTAAAGLAITSAYEVVTTAANQVDILFSDRAFNKTTSTGSAVGDYDGVDIQFNHALSVVQVKVAAANTAAVGNVKVTSISVEKVANKGTFAQNYTNGVAPADPEWTLSTGSYSEYVFGAAEYTLAGTTLTTYGDYHILLPQTFVADGVTLVINYAIKHGTKWLPQENTYTLYNAGNYYADSSSNKVEGWEMGKRYTYNFTIGLDQVYFAPQVDQWVEVNVTVPQI